MEGIGDAALFPRAVVTTMYCVRASLCRGLDSTKCSGGGGGGGLFPWSEDTNAEGL